MDRDRMLPTAVLASATLVLAFAIARTSDARALGGVVLAAGAAWCVARSWREAGWWRVGAVVVIAVVAFAGAHVLARALGPWLAVALAAAVLGAATYVLVDTAPRRDSQSVR